MSSQAQAGQTIDEALELARGHVYSFLASALSDPARTHVGLALDSVRGRVAVAAADLVREETPAEMDLAPVEVSPARLDLRPIVKELARPRPELIKEHQRVFGLLSGKAARLNETEHCPSTDSFHRAQELADVAGFYRAFGLERDAEDRERADHISLELDFMAHLVDKEMRAAAASDPRLQEKAAVCRDAQRKFFEAHLAWWVPGFAHLLRCGVPSGLYGALALALAAFIPAERYRLHVKAISILARTPPPPEKRPGDAAGSCAG